jgi:hypothetical protein
VAPVSLVLLTALALRANLSEWVQNLAVDTGLRAVFFRSEDVAHNIGSEEVPIEILP